MACSFESLIPCVPDWVILLFVVFSLIAIYLFALNEESKTEVKKFLRAYGIWAVLVVAWMYWRFKTGPIIDFPDKWPADMNRADFIMGLVALLYFGFKSWLYEQRYNTYQFTCDNVSGSCHRWHRIGSVVPGQAWMVFFVGGSGPSDERFTIPWPWVKRIVVVPESAVQMIGNHIVCFSQVQKLTTPDLLELDEDVAEFILKDTFGRWAKESVYFGIWNIETKMIDPKYQDFENKYIKVNSRINENKEMLRGKLNTMKTFVSDTMGMTKKLKGDDWRKPQTNNGPGEE